MSEPIIYIAIDDDGDYEVWEANEYSMYFDEPQEVGEEVQRILSRREEESKT